MALPDSNFITDSDMKTKINSREILFLHSNTLSHSAFPVRVSFYLLFLSLPAFIYGCGMLEAPYNSSTPPAASAEMPVKTSIGIDGQILSLDIFSFNDDGAERLDSYQRFDEGQFWGNTCKIGTTAGRKRLVLLANMPFSRYDWVDINCCRSLEKRRFELEDEEPQTPSMVSDHRIEAGQPIFPQMEALTGEVVLRSLRCDFLGKDYSDEMLTDVKFYLTNVNASCGIWENEDGAPSRIINSGRLNMDDVSKFRFPELVYGSLESPVGIRQMDLNARMRAFASHHEDESIGTPFTKLVIEGKIRGNTYYYPIAINRGPGTEDSGLHRNTRYIYDITITQTGLTDPDGMIQDINADIDLEVETWKEKDWYDIRF